MNIVIMRHGEAEMRAASDAQRQLTERGQQQTLEAGRRLSSTGFIPDLVWVSPFIRARQTAAAVMQSYAPDIPQFIQDAITPEGQPEQVMAMLEKAGCDNILLVSHQPLVSALVGMLTDGASYGGPPMAPASMAQVHAGSVLPGCCDLVWLRHAPNFEVSYE